MKRKGGRKTKKEELLGRGFLFDSNDGVGKRAMFMM